MATTIAAGVTNAVNWRSLDRAKTDTLSWHHLASSASLFAITIRLGGTSQALATLLLERYASDPLPVRIILP